MQLFRVQLKNFPGAVGGYSFDFTADISKL
jgi:hypothetical protein